MKKKKDLDILDDQIANQDLKESKQVYIDQLENQENLSTEQSPLTEQNQNIENIDQVRPKKNKISKETKKSLKIKKQKQPKNIKKTFEEFPIKMMKETSKIRWSGSGNLGRKFVIVIIFMAIFALVFFGVDLIVQQLFKLIKVF